MKLTERLEVTRRLIWEASTYQDLLEFMSYDLHGTPSRIDQNEGLRFIWRSLMGLQILTLSKLIKDDGAFSLQKLINIAGAEVKGFDRAQRQSEFDDMLVEFQKNNLGIVRDKFLAHLDISADEVKTDIHMLCIAKNQAASLFDRVSKSVGAKEYQHNDRVVAALKRVFDDLDDYQKVKAVILAAEIQGEREIDIDNFISIKG